MVRSSVRPLRVKYVWTWSSYLMATCLVRALCCCWISSWAASRLKAFLASNFLMVPLLSLLFFTLAGSPPPLLSTG